MFPVMDMPLWVSSATLTPLEGLRDDPSTVLAATVRLVVGANTLTAVKFALPPPDVMVLPLMVTLSNDPPAEGRLLFNNWTQVVLADVLKPVIVFPAMV
jgi:hypothetical protein